MPGLSRQERFVVSPHGTEGIGGDPARMPTSNAIKKYPLPAAKGLPQAFQRPKGAAALCHQFETTILQAL